LGLYDLPKGLQPGAASMPLEVHTTKNTTHAETHPLHGEKRTTKHHTIQESLMAGTLGSRELASPSVESQKKGVKKGGLAYLLHTNGRRGLKPSVGSI